MTFVAPFAVYCREERCTSGLGSECYSSEAERCRALDVMAIGEDLVNTECE